MKIGARVMVDVSGFVFLVEENKRRDVTLKGTRAGAKVMIAASRVEAPRRVGALKKAQGVKAAKGRNGLTTSFAAIGSRKDWDRVVAVPGRKKPMRVVPAFYDHLVQGGAKPHSVSKGQSLGRKQKVSKTGKVYGKIIGRTNQTGRLHPGSRPNPFRKRAWDSAKGRIGDEMMKAMAEAERVIMNRAARKAFKGI